MDPQLSQAVKNYNLRGANPNRCKAIEQYAGKKVLDCGCGNGAYVYKYIETKDMYGVDYRRFDSWELLEERFKVCSAEDLSIFPDNSFDTVLSFETLEHLKDPKRALEEMRRVTRDNIIITVPNCKMTEGMKASQLTFGHYIDPTHIQFWDLAGIQKLIERAGFEVVTAEPINKMTLWPFVSEALGLDVKNGGLKSKFIGRLMRLTQRKDYYLTSLVVARKTGELDSKTHN